MIIGNFTRSFFRTCQPLNSVSKSALAKLRKTTGYSFSKCKEALNKHDHNLEEAEKWLRDQAQQHGWEKAAKLKGRATAQGLVSIVTSQDYALMMEINCETDFVARNKKFRTLVDRISNECLIFLKDQHAPEKDLFKRPLSQIELSNIPLHEGSLLKDTIALGIGEVGENIKARRGIFLTSKDPVAVVGYTHPAVDAPDGSVKKGRYGAVVAYKSSKKPNPERFHEIGRQLCQHIVGMNPKEIGNISDPPKTNKESEPPKQEVSQIEQESQDNQFKDVEFQAKQFEEDIDVLVDQEFLLDPDLSVREYLIQNSVEVVDFVRFECGENFEPSKLE